MRKRMNGEGSVYRRKSDGRWVAALSMGSRSDRVIHRRYARTKTEAKILLDELRTGQTTTGTVLLSDYLARWVRDARDIRPTTRHGYEAVVTYHLIPAIGHLRLVDLTPLDVDRMLRDMQGRMAPKTARNIHIVLRRALGQAVRADLVTRNVASREFVDAPRVIEEDPRVLSVDDEARLLDAAAGDVVEPHIIVALGTGLRQGELLGLQWGDVGPTRLHVRRELVYRAGTYRLEDPKTPRSKRSVPLAPAVADAFEMQRAAVKAAGFVPIATGPVFPNRSGGPLSGSWLTHRLYVLEDAAGIERLPFKNLRSTFSSRLYDLGVPDRTIADLMGHATTKTTHRHYIATTPEQAVEAVARLTLTRHSPSVANEV